MRVIWKADNAHLRRYVLEAAKAGEMAALPLLKDITRLYRIERQATDQQMTAAQRGALRYAKAKPILKRLQHQFRALERDTPLFGKLREAVIYANHRGAIWRDMPASSAVTS